MKTNLFLTVCLLASFYSCSQTVEYFDGEWNRVNSKAEAEYYREITYDEKGKPVGKVRDFYVSGKIQFEGKLLSVNPDTQDGFWIIYKEDGSFENAGIYKEGVPYSPEFPARYKDFSFKDASGLFHGTQTEVEQALAKLNAQFDASFAIKTETADVLNHIGLMRLQQGNLGMGNCFLQLSYDISKLLGYDFQLMQSSTNLGLLAFHLGRYETAVTQITEALSIKKGIGSDTLLNVLYFNLARTYQELTQFDQALQNYDFAIEVEKRNNYKEHISDSFRKKGEVYQLLGQYDLAQYWLEKAKDAAIEIGDELQVASANFIIGVVRAAEGRYQEAMTLFEEVKRFYEGRQDLQFLKDVYNNIAYVHEKQKNYHKALEYYEKALVIQKSLGRPIAVARTLMNIGQVYKSQQEFDLTLEYCHKARELLENSQARFLLMGCYLHLGTTHLMKGENKKALQWFERASPVFDSLNSARAAISLFNNLGIVNSRLGRKQEAFKWTRKALKAAKKLGSDDELASICYQLSNLYFQDSELDSARIYSIKALELFDHIRSINSGLLDREIFLEKNLPAAEVAILSSFRTNKNRLAFNAAEKIKARGIVDLLAEKEIAQVSLPGKVDTPLKQIRARINAVNFTLTTDIPKANRRMLTEERDSLFAETLILQDRIRVLAPEYANLVYPQAVNYKQVQSVMAHDEVVVNYFIGSEKALVFLITPKKILVFDLGDTKPLSRLIERFRHDLIPAQKLAIERGDPMMQNKADKLFFEISGELYQRLWNPLRLSGLLSDNKIILIPDGFLNYLPFELLTRDQEQKNYEDYHYIAKEHRITYYPSATLLHFERTRDGQSATAKQDFFGLGISEFTNTSCTNDSSNYPNLSSIAASIVHLGSLFPSNKSLTVLDESANENAFKNLSLGDYRYLHFATHGVINPETPDFSSILLQPDGEEDGCLNMYEIFELDLNADLVTLAACQTGLGQLVRGEGMIGFTRALMFAGTPSVILSLWEVVDESTNQLFLDYYSKLAKDGSDKYQPLRAAQLEMIESGEHSNPYYWAPFVFIGARESKWAK